MSEPQQHFVMEAETGHIGPPSTPKPQAPEQVEEKPDGGIQ
jgi:hypothetical protein